MKHVVLALRTELFVIVTALALAACGSEVGDTRAVDGRNILESMVSTARAQGLSAYPKGAPPPSSAEIEKIITQYGRAPEKGGIIGRLAPKDPNVETKSADKEKAVFVNAWNYFIPIYCIGIPYGSERYFYMYFLDGTYTYTTDPVTITMLATACVASPIVGLYVTAASGPYFAYSMVLVNHL